MPMEQQQQQQQPRHSTSATSSPVVDEEEVKEDICPTESIVASPSCNFHHSKSNPIKYYKEHDIDEDSEEEFIEGSDEYCTTASSNRCHHREV
jgi:hypothetical protein